MHPPTFFFHCNQNVAEMQNFSGLSGLGVNDVNQINSGFLKNDAEFLDTFIKRRMNNSIGQRKTEHAQKLIEDSHIICIFGMSIGSTDKMWWEEIVKWLNRSDNNKLVIYYKD